MRMMLPLSVLRWRSDREMLSVLQQGPRWRTEEEKRPKEEKEKEEKEEKEKEQEKSST